MVSRELQAALDAALAAADVIEKFYQRNLAVTLKADKSSITVADVRAEEAVRAVLCTRFPDYGFYGEETGSQGMDADNIWLVDPIDGTKSFVRDCPFFSTQIALMREGRLVLGVSSAAAYGELAWAEEGAGAFLDGKRMHVSAIADLGAAIVSTGNLKTMAASAPHWSRLGALIGRINRLRGYGDFLHYHLLARGAEGRQGRQVQFRERLAIENFGGRTQAVAAVAIEQQRAIGEAFGQRRIVQRGDDAGASRAPVSYT